MPLTVTMPQLGESVTEGTIARWLKQPGDAIAKYEFIAEVITDKVNAEIPAPADGVMAQVIAPEGTVVPVGQPICSIETSVPASASDAPSCDGRVSQARGRRLSRPLRRLHRLCRLRRRLSLRSRERPLRRRPSRRSLRRRHRNRWRRSSLRALSGRARMVISRRLLNPPMGMGRRRGITSRLRCACSCGSTALISGSSPGAGSGGGSRKRTFSSTCSGGTPGLCPCGRRLGCPLRRLHRLCRLRRHPSRRQRLPR